jgi:hypothetical protein
MVLNTYEAQIDHVLDLLRNHASYLTKKELFDKVSESTIKVEPSFYDVILEKLERDKYIHLHNQKGYITTFEGYVFIGYVNDKKLNEERILSLSIVKAEAKKYSHRLLMATWCAGAGAVLLLLWQVWIWFYPVHAHYPYWIWETIPAQRR